jgi:hypothetical protein
MAALEVYRQAGKDQTPHAAILKVNLAMALAYQRRFAEGEPILLEGIATLREMMGDTHPWCTPALERGKKFYTWWNKPEQAAAFDTK